MIVAPARRCDQPSAGEPVYEPDVEGWRQTGRAEQFRARIVNYADDLVILSRGKAKEALGWLRGALERLELTLNEKKTSLRMRGGSDSTSRVYIRAALQRADWPGVYRIQSIEEEREPDEAERGRAPGAWEPPSMGRSAGPAESETERLGSILRTGQYGSGVSGDR